jgi:hypothetical protein
MALWLAGIRVGTIDLKISHSQKVVVLSIYAKPQKA